MSSHAGILRLAAKGRTLLHELERAIEERGQQYVPFPEIAPRYSTRISPPWEPRFESQVAAIVGANGQPFDGYQLVAVDSVPPRAPTPYSNYVHRNGRVILCTYNFAEMDANEGNRMHWSDIVNPETQGVINAINNRVFGPSRDEDRFFDLTPEDGDEFFALLGTVHRKGPLRMLATYPRYFGCKTIARVRVYPEAAAPPRSPGDDTTPLSRKGRRDRKKGRRSRQNQPSSVG